MARSSITYFAQLLSNKRNQTPQVHGREEYGVNNYTCACQRKGNDITRELPMPIRTSLLFREFIDMVPSSLPTVQI